MFISTSLVSSPFQAAIVSFGVVYPFSSFRIRIGSSWYSPFLVQVGYHFSIVVWIWAYVFEPIPFPGYRCGLLLSLPRALVSVRCVGRLDPVHVPLWLNAYTFCPSLSFSQRHSTHALAFCFPVMEWIFVPFRFRVLVVSLVTCVVVSTQPSLAAFVFVADCCMSAILASFSNRITFALLFHSQAWFSLLLLKASVSFSPVMLFVFVDCWLSFSSPLAVSFSYRCSSDSLCSSIISHGAPTMCSVILHSAPIMIRVSIFIPHPNFCFRFRIGRPVSLYGIPGQRTVSFWVGGDWFALFFYILIVDPYCLALAVRWVSLIVHVLAVVWSLPHWAHLSLVLSFFTGFSLTVANITLMSSLYFPILFHIPYCYSSMLVLWSKCS